MYVNLTKSGFLKLFQQIGHFIRSYDEPGTVLQKSVEAVGWHFLLDRCIALLFDKEKQEMLVFAEFHADSVPALGARRYQVRSNSEWYQLLSEGKPLPLKDISLASGEPSGSPEMDQYIRDSESKSLVAFPLVSGGAVVGCLSMHHCQEAKGFSDEVLEFGESLAEELAQSISKFRLQQERIMESAAFKQAQLPMLVVGAEDSKIRQANVAALRLFDPVARNLIQMHLAELLPNAEVARLREIMERIVAGAGQPSARLDKLVLRTAAGQPADFEVIATPLAGEANNCVLMLLVPAQAQAKEECRDSSGTRVDEVVSVLSRQLHWERVARSLTANLCSTFDRDVILQTAVDALSRVLGVSRALIVKTEGPASPLVTHEFAVADISPLGLGRTSQFPTSAVVCFRNKSASFPDLTAAPRLPELTPADLKTLVEGGVVSMAGCPVAHHLQYHGMILVMQSDKPRQWTQEEIILLETIAEQISVALNHAQAYMQVKDQLFNMNLIGNLTQQLTNVLDLATRAARPEPAPEAARPAGATPPLSSREMEVLKLIAFGLANREIAQRLFLTESTVELHASRIRKKLKLKSRTALVKYACDNHLV